MGDGASGPAGRFLVNQDQRTVALTPSGLQFGPTESRRPNPLRVLVEHDTLTVVGLSLGFGIGLVAAAAFYQHQAAAMAFGIFALLCLVGIVVLKVVIPAAGVGVLLLSLFTRRGRRARAHELRTLAAASQATTAPSALAHTVPLPEVTRLWASSRQLAIVTRPGVTYLLHAPRGEAPALQALHSALVTACPGAVG